MQSQILDFLFKLCKLAFRDIIVFFCVPRFYFIPSLTLRHELTLSDLRPQSSPAHAAPQARAPVVSEQVPLLDFTKEPILRHIRGWS